MPLEPALTVNIPDVMSDPAAVIVLVPLVVNVIPPLAVRTIGMEMLPLVDRIMLPVVARDIADVVAIALEPALTDKESIDVRAVPMVRVEEPSVTVNSPEVIPSDTLLPSGFIVRLAALTVSATGPVIVLPVEVNDNAPAVVTMLIAADVVIDPAVEIERDAIVLGVDAMVRVVLAPVTVI